MSLNLKQQHEIRNALVNLEWFRRKLSDAQLRDLMLFQMKRIEEALKVFEMKTETQVLIIIFILTLVSQWTLTSPDDITNIVIGGLLGYLTKDTLTQN